MTFTPNPPAQSPHLFPMVVFAPESAPESALPALQIAATSKSVVIQPKPPETKPQPANKDVNVNSFAGAHTLHADFMQMYRKGLAESRMKDHPMRTPRFFQMIQMLQLTTGLKGATAEAGCFRGLASWLICQTQQNERPQFLGESHFMVDSFQGLSQPLPQDGPRSQKRFEEGAFKGTSLQHVRQTLCQFPKVNLIKGWIPNAFSDLPEQSYRFVHIDVDIYQPTIDSLRYFYSRLVSGGIIVVDDFGPWPDGSWPGCSKAVRQFAEEVRVPFASLDTGNAVFIKRG